MKNSETSQSTYCTRLHYTYVVKSDHTMNSYSISRWTWKLKKKLFFHPLYIINFNRFITLASYSPKLLQWLLRLTLVRDLLPRIRGGQGIMNSDHRIQMTSPHPSANYFDLTKDTTNTGIRQVREFSAMSVPLKQRNQNKIQESRMQHGIACYSMFHSISHKTAFLRTS